MLKILILGGYGVFGGRLAKLPSDIAAIELLIGGRNLSRAEACGIAFNKNSYPIRNGSTHASFIRVG